MAKLVLEDMTDDHLPAKNRPTRAVPDMRKMGQCCKPRSLVTTIQVSLSVHLSELAYILWHLGANLADPRAGGKRVGFNY